MSNHGSFVTQYISCKHCFGKLMDLLVSKYEDKFFVPTTIENKMRDGALYPVIAGKIASSSDVAGIFLYEIADEIADVICCDVIIVVIDDIGEVHRFMYGPNKQVKHSLLEKYSEAE